MCGFYWWNSPDLGKKEDKLWELLFQIGAEYTAKEGKNWWRESLKYGSVKTTVTHYDDYRVVTIRVGKSMTRWKERYPGYVYDVEGDMEAVLDKAIAYLQKMKKRKKKPSEKKAARKRAKRKGEKR